MAAIASVEDIQAWQQARELTRQIYEVSARTEFARDFRLQGQIRAAATSIMSNIAEGFQRAGNREFLHFLAIAKGSVGELKSQLYVALDVGYMTHEEFKGLFEVATSTERLIGGFIRYLRSSNLRGSRFK